MESSKNKYEDLVEKLELLSRQEMLRHLKILAGRSEETAAYLEMVVADCPEVHLREKISEFKCFDDHFRYDELFALSQQLCNLLENIANQVLDPDAAINLVLDFYETDCHVFEHCDDDGVIGDVYSDDADNLLKSLWLKSVNRETHKERIKVLVVNNDYGVRDALLPYLKI